MNFKLIAFSLISISFVACNDDDAYDFSAVEDSPLKTRSHISTKNLVKERLNELGDKYGVPVILSENTDPADITDEFFDFVEQGLKQKASLSDADTKLNPQDLEIISEHEEGEISDLVIINDWEDDSSIKAVAIKSSTTVPEYGSFTDNFTVSYYLHYNGRKYSYNDSFGVRISWDTEKVPNVARFEAIDSYFSFSDKPSVDYYVTNELATIPTPNFSYSYDVGARHYDNDSNKLIKSQIIATLVGRH